MNEIGINKINLKDKIKEADMLLVGIGEEFGIDFSKMREKPKYNKALSEIEAKEELRWILPHIEKNYMLENRNEQIKDAYNRLEKLLEGKNYFIVSTCTDDYIYDTNLDKARIVTPCGGYYLQQCAENCENKVFEANEEPTKEIYSCLQDGRNLTGIRKTVCGKCGGDIVFNNVRAKNYAEEGYLEQWNIYTKWIKETVNRKLCVLELGVGMQFPTVVRWPFEKIVFFNYKSYLFRIHSKLFQLTEEVKDRGCSVKENPIDFLLNRFV